MIPIEGVERDYFSHWLLILGRHSSKLLFDDSRPFRIGNINLLNWVFHDLVKLQFLLERLVFFSTFGWGLLWYQAGLRFVIHLGAIEALEHWVDKRMLNSKSRFSLIAFDSQSNWWYWLNRVLRFLILCWLLGYYLWVRHFIGILCEICFTFYTPIKRFCTVCLFVKRDLVQRHRHFNVRHYNCE